MKEICFIMMSLFVSYNLFSQCSSVSRGNSNLNSTLNTFSATTDRSLNDWFKKECAQVENVFEVYPEFHFYNEGDDCNAQAIDDKVIFGINMINKFSNNRAALLGVLAHEYAHILQIDNDCDLSVKKKELHADLLAGYFLAAKGYVLGQEEVENFIKVFFTLGDYEFNNSQHHGTPRERSVAANKGYYEFGMMDDIDEVYEKSLNFIKNNF